MRKGEKKENESRRYEKLRESISNENHKEMRKERNIVN